MKKEDVFQKMSRIHFSFQMISLVTFAHQIKNNENFEILLDTLYKIHGSKCFKEALEVENLEGNRQEFMRLATSEISKLFDEFAALCDEIDAKDFQIYAPMFFSTMFNIVTLQDEKQKRIIRKAARVLYEAKDSYAEENLENLMNFISEDMQDLLLYEMEKRTPIEKRIYLMPSQNFGEA